MKHLINEVSAEKNIIHAVYHLIRRRWSVLLLMMSIATIGALANHYVFPRYIAVSKLIVRSQSESPLLMAMGKVVNYASMGMDQSFAPLSDRYVKMLGSQDFVEFVEAELKSSEDVEVARLVMMIKNIESRWEFARPERAPVTVLFSSLRVKGKEEIIEFSLNSASPEMSLIMSSVVAKLAYKFLTEYDLKEIKDTLEYLTKVTGENAQRIRKLSEDLNFLRFDAGMTINESGSPSDSVTMQGIQRFSEEAANIEVKINENQALTKRLLKDIKSAFSTVEQATESMRSGALYSERGKLVDRMKFLKSDRDILESRLQALNQQLRSMIKRMQSSVEQNIFELSKKIEIEHDLSRDLNKQLLETQMYQISVENKIRRHESATANSVFRDSSSPKKVLIACILTLFLTAFGVYLWEQFNPLLSDRSDFMQLGIRFLGGVPQLFKTHIFFRRPKSGLSVEEAMKRVYKSNARSSESLCFQFLATRVMGRLQKVTGGKGGCLGVVSMCSGEGKTLISSNLAIALSMHNNKVLYIDGDYLNFRKHPYFESDVEHGLYEVLKGSTEIQKVIRPTKFGNLHFLPSGNCTATLDVFNEELIRQLITGLKRHYDFVVFDTPAFRAGPESIMFNSHTDLTVIVGIPYQTRMDELKELNDALEGKGQTQIVGVFNRFSTLSFKSDYYYMSKTARSAEDRGAA